MIPNKKKRVALNPPAPEPVELVDLAELLPPDDAPPASEEGRSFWVTHPDMDVAMPLDPLVVPDWEDRGFKRTKKKG